MGLTLREGNREYFYSKLDIHFPGIKQKYKKMYGNSYDIMSSKNDELMAYFIEVCKKHNIIYNVEEVFKYMSIFPNKHEQLQLFK